MIRGIPNQPIDFVGDDLIGCATDIVSPLLIAQEDDFIFQFVIGRCEDAEEYIDEPNFFTGWLAGGEWKVKVNNTCAEPGQAGATIEYPWNPTAGEVYEVEVVVTTITGSGITVSLGGVDTIINAPGTHTFIITAADTGVPVVTLIDDTSSVCLYSFQVYAANTDVTIQVTDDQGDEVWSTTIDDTPQYFTISGDHVTAIIPVDELGLTDGDCYKVNIIDPCPEYAEDGTLCSQSIKVGNCKDTIKLRVCNDHDQESMDFVAGRFEMRVTGIVIRPTFRYTAEEEKLTNGYINRHRIEREEEREFRITDAHMGYWAHRFVSSLCMFDHLYIGTREYIVNVDEYSPQYPDSINNTGAISLILKPKQELFRKVLCEPAGAGCNPENDPICTTPNVIFFGPVEDEGLYNYTVALTSMTGFVTGTLTLRVNGEDQTPITFDTAPALVDLGSFAPGSVVTATITNVDDPTCNYTTTLYIPCECSDTELYFQLGTVTAPSEDFEAADGVAAVQAECVADRPSWNIAGGAGSGGITGIWNTTHWYFYDGTGVGFMSLPGVDFRNPCDVDDWYTTEDGTTPGEIRSVRVCGGGEATCEADCCNDGPAAFNCSSTISSYYNGKRSGEDVWTNAGTLNGKIHFTGGLVEVLWTEDDTWYILDPNGIGLMSDEGVDHPCQVAFWYFTDDGVTPGELSDATFCGGVE